MGCWGTDFCNVTVCSSSVDTYTQVPRGQCLVAFVDAAIHGALPCRLGFDSKHVCITMLSPAAFAWVHSSRYTISAISGDSMQ
jgi:hypothetical protein